METLGLFMTVALIGTVIAVNVWQRRHLARMSKEERAKDAEERADYEAARGKAKVPASLGTFADLLKGRKL